MIFVDAGPLVGKIHRRDQHNARAEKLWPLMTHEQCVTSNLVIVETMNILTTRIGACLAVPVAESLFRSRWLKIIPSTRVDEIAALTIMNKYQEHGIGMADAVSMVMMKKLGMTKVCTFDWHFSLAGFEPISPE